MTNGDASWTVGACASSSKFVVIAPVDVDCIIFGGGGGDAGLLLGGGGVVSMVTPDHPQLVVNSKRGLMSIAMRTTQDTECFSVEGWAAVSR